MGLFGYIPTIYNDWKCMDYTYKKEPLKWFDYNFDDSTSLCGMKRIFIDN